MNQNDLYLKYAEIIKMCQGTALENTPWLCVRFNGGEFNGHPRFDTLVKNYQFAVAILEDRAVFVGDKVYGSKTGDEFDATEKAWRWFCKDENEYQFYPFGTPFLLTWQPPKTKRRIVLEETDDYKTDISSGYVLLDGERIDYIQAGHSLTPPHKIWRMVEDTGNKP